MSWHFWATYFERLGIVAIALGLLYVVARKLRELRLLPRAGRRLNVLESTMLSPHAALHIVRVGERYFFIATTPGEVRSLAELTASDATLTR